MKKEMGTLLLLSAVMFSGCSPDNKEDTTQEQGSGETPSEQVTTQQDAKLIGTSENKEIKLYEATNGVKLDFNGKEKDFNWSFDNSGVLNPPQVFYTDVTGDGNEEAVIIIHTGKGTELDNYNIHVVNKDFTEIKVPEYEEIVANHIESKVVKKDDGTLGIAVKAQGKEFNVDYDANPEPKLELEKDELGFGAITIYYLENQKIKLHLAASAFPKLDGRVSQTFVADFFITYKFDSAKNEFMVDQIEVKPI
ncbi:hypothetical protein ACQKMI_04200 [Lysinibacillus sp. NPDC097214]|uniref:hypothetical protein n=1 Tax=Lysinibacillus sp. NPDC097214 TaxID=3390584 RepID=UPI003CFF3667